MKTVKTEVLSALLSFIYEGEDDVIKEADTVPFIETAQKWRKRQFLRVKRKKNPEKITNQANAGGDGVGGGDGGGGMNTETAALQVNTCKFSPNTFPTKKRKDKHLWKKTFKISGFSGDLNYLTKKDEVG